MRTKIHLDLTTRNRLKVLVAGEMRNLVYLFDSGECHGITAHYHMDKKEFRDGLVKVVVSRL